MNYNKISELFITKISSHPFAMVKYITFPKKNESHYEPLVSPAIWKNTYI